MLAAASTDTRNKTPSWGRDCMFGEPILSARTPKTSRPHVTTVGQTARNAKANHSSGGGGSGQRHILLVSAQASPPECRRLPLGHPPGGAACRAPESLRYAARAVPPASSVPRLSVFASGAGSCRRTVLRNQLSSAGLRAHARKLWQTA